MIIALRWMLKVKSDEHSDVESIRQGLLLSVFHRKKTLKKSIDFKELCTQKVSNKCIRIFLVNAPNQIWTVYQRSVKTAFLNGKLNDVVYVSQPEGFVVRDRPTHVYRLLKGPLWPLAGA